MNKQQQPTIVQAVPIQPQIQVLQGQVTQPPSHIKLTFAYAKSVKLFAAIEAFFLILYGFYQPWFFLQAIGPIIGYYGAKKFNNYLSYFYFTYLIMALLSKLIILALTFQNADGFYIFISFVIMIIDIWILKISASFIHYLHDLTTDERNNLRHMHIITTYHYW
jgi:hypothetical protein